jgi:hypothetical protein
MDPWCAYLLFAQQQEAAQAPMQRHMQDLVTPKRKPSSPPALPASQQTAARGALPSPPPLPTPGSGRIVRC